MYKYIIRYVNNDVEEIVCKPHSVRFGSNYLTIKYETGIDKIIPLLHIGHIKLEEVKK